MAKPELSRYSVAQCHAVAGRTAAAVQAKNGSQEIHEMWTTRYIFTMIHRNLTSALTYILRYFDIYWHIDSLTYWINFLEPGNMEKRMIKKRIFDTESWSPACEAATEARNLFSQTWDRPGQPGWLGLGATHWSIFLGRNHVIIM